MNHHRQAIRLSALENGREAAVALQIIIGRQHLMRRVQFQGPNSDLREAIHLGAWAGNCAGKYTSKRKQTVWG